MILFARVCVVLTAALLSACASIEKIAQTKLPTAQKQHSFSFSVEARFSLQYKDERWIGGLDWIYDEAREKLTLNVAGQSLGVFERVDGVVYAQLADQRSLQASSWSELTGKAIGVSLPFESAAYWLRGEPEQRGEFKRDNAETFSQRGWTIAVLARDEARRPSRLRWTSDNITLTLVIDQWRTP